MFSMFRKISPDPNVDGKIDAVFHIEDGKIEYDLQFKPINDSCSTKCMFGYYKKPLVSIKADDIAQELTNDFISIYPEPETLFHVFKYTCKIKTQSVDEESSGEIRVKTGLNQETLKSYLEHTVRAINLASSDVLNPVPLSESSSKFPLPRP